MKVLVVDEGFIGSLHTAIGLRGAGLEVVLLGAVGRASRYGSHYDSRGFTAVLGPPPPDPAFVPAVRHLAASSSCDLILPTTEPTMLALHGAALMLPAPLFPRLDARQAALIGSKAAMSEMAASNDARIPHQLQVSSPAELPAAVHQIGLPAVVKATFGRGGDGTRIVGDEDTARAALRALLMAGRDCILQEHVAGPTFLAGGLFGDGAPIRFYAGEKVEQQPEGTGPASVILSVHQERLQRAALSIFQALRWTGLASADFMRAADGEFVFLEVNPRPWGSIAAAADAGVDLFGPLAELLRGGSPAPDLRYTAGVKTPVLPLYLLRPHRWLSWRGLTQLSADLRSPQALPFRDMRLLAHVGRRLLRVRANWPS